MAATLVEPIKTLKTANELTFDKNIEFKISGRPLPELKIRQTSKAKNKELDGRIHEGHFTYTAGGVARNISEALCKLGYPPNFISAIGDDEPGRLLKTFIPPESVHMVKVVKSGNTAQCIIVFNNKGDCKFLIGDMGIHREITPDVVQSHENIIRTAPLIILDGNLTIETIGEVLRLADRYSIPVLFEPTDVEIAAKPFETPYWKSVKFITPNINELKFILSFLNIPHDDAISNTIDETAFLAKQLADYLENVIVTLGPDGVIIARKALATNPLLKCKKKDKVYVRHYPGDVIKDIVNVSGAGDCLASGIAAAMLSGLSEEECVSVGFQVARESLYSSSAIPKELFDCRTLPSSVPLAAFATIF